MILTGGHVNPFPAQKCVLLMQYVPLRKNLRQIKGQPEIVIVYNSDFSCTVRILAGLSVMSFRQMAIKALRHGRQMKSQGKWGKIRSSWKQLQMPTAGSLKPVRCSTRSPLFIRRPLFCARGHFSLEGLFSAGGHFLLGGLCFLLTSCYQLEATFH